MADLTVAAEDVECTRYVAAVGKIIRVPCDDSGSPDRKGSESEPGPTVHLTPAELEKAAPLRNQLVQLSDAIKSAEGDAAFRDSYCTAVEMASLVRSAKNRRERKKLFDETIAMQARLGERGRLVSAALTKPVTDALLDTPINEAGGDPRLRDTPEGEPSSRPAAGFDCPVPACAKCGRRGGFGAATPAASTSSRRASSAAPVPAGLTSGPRRRM
ncbi:MAG: hypothetical protein M5U16_16625 [Hyphomicrobium sp.]|nr:hypothetical protein [Hyphomicrobium sp.]